MKTQNVYDNPNNLVYCKPVTDELGRNLVAVYGSQGLFLNAFLGYDVAFACARNNDFTPVYVN
jgi:hypothetical protein